MEERKKRTIIAAGSYQHFLVWCRENERNPNDISVVYLSRPEVLLGRCLCVDCAEIVYYETFADHPNFLELSRAIRRAQAMGHIYD
jgi:hypothetical protein